MCLQCYCSFLNVSVERGLRPSPLPRMRGTRPLSRTTKKAGDLHAWWVGCVQIRSSKILSPILMLCVFSWGSFHQANPTQLLTGYSGVTVTEVLKQGNGQVRLLPPQPLSLLTLTGSEIGLRSWNGCYFRVCQSKNCRCFRKRGCFFAVK